MSRGGKRRPWPELRWTALEADMSAIDDKYTQLGGVNGFLGSAVTPELQTPNGLGFYRHYAHGSIYHKATLPVAFEIHGLIRQRWAEMGWESSLLGFPLTDEVDVPGAAGRTNTFEGGVISWTPTTGAHEVYGAILRRWVGLGREAGFGFPLTGELGTSDGRGRFNHFQRGSIYWTSQSGAQPIVGAMKDVWAGAGWERGPLGYPIGAEFIMPPGGVTFQDFDNGYLCMQSNLAAFSRTVIQPRRIIAMPVTMLGWGSFGGARLPDNDLISVSFGPAKNPNTNITLTLRTGPAVTWWKAIGIWTPSRGTIVEAFTQDAKKTATVSLRASDLERSDAFLIFKKAKFLGIHTEVYWLTPTRNLLGHDVTFTWTAD